MTTFDDISSQSDLVHTNYGILCLLMIPKSAKSLISQILPLLNDKDSDAVQQARSTLAKLGYQK